MTDQGPSQGGFAAPFETDAEALMTAWQRTVEELAAMAAAREDQGWEALSVPARDTVPEHRQVGETDRFGLGFVIPDDHALPFEDFFRRGSYPEYEVYRKTVQNRVFLVVEYRDPEIERVILVAGAYDRRNAQGMVEDAETAGEFFTHHEALDGDHLGTFRHDSHEKFVPEAAPGED